MKRVVIHVVSIMFALGVIFCGTRKETYAEMKYLNFVADAKSMTTVSLSWKAGNVTKYKIYRAVCNGNHHYHEEEDEENNTDQGIKEEYQLIATLSKKKTEYLDQKAEKGKTYHYEIKGYKNGKQKYDDEVTIYLGLLCSFGGDGEELPIFPAFANAESATLILRYDNGYDSDVGIIPDGYKIYRKKGGKEKFHFLTNIKLDRNAEKFKDACCVLYTDHHVEEGTTYYYRARSYKTFENKQYYSPYTDEISVYTVNEEGTYQVKFVQDETCAEDEAVILLMGQKGNEKMILNSWNQISFKKKDGTSGEIDTDIIKYSKDGKNWKSYDMNQKEDLSLKEEEAIWLKIKSSGKEKINCVDEFTEFYAHSQVIYNNEEDHYFYMDLIDGKAWTENESEF